MLVGVGGCCPNPDSSNVHIHWESSGGSHAGAQPVLKGEHCLISIVSKKDHHAVSRVDPRKQQIKIIDGCLSNSSNHQIKWTTVVKRMFQKTGLVHSNFETENIHMCHQANTNDCGPVVCGVVWDLLSHLMPLPKETPVSEKFSVKKCNNKMKPLCVLIWNKKQVLMMLHQEELLVKSGKPEQKVANFPSKHARSKRDASLDETVAQPQESANKK